MLDSGFSFIFQAVRVNTHPNTPMTNMKLGSDLNRYAPHELGTCMDAGAFPITRGAGWDPPVRSIYIQPPWSGVCTCFALTNLGRFRLQRLSASSIVATPHWGDCSFSDDLRIDEISATGGHRFFAPAGETLPSFARSAKECLSQWTGILTMFHI